MPALTFPGVQFPLSWVTLGLARPVPGKTGLQAPRLFDIPATNLKALANYAWYSYERERRLVAKQVNKRYAKIRQDIAQSYADAFSKATSRFWASGPQALKLKTQGQDIKAQLARLDQAALRKPASTPVRGGRPGASPGAARYAPKWSAQEALEPDEIPDVDVTPVLGRDGRPSSSGSGAGLGLGLGLLLMLLLRRRSRR